VLVIEAGDKPGGSTAMSGGVVYAAGSSVQRAAGIRDHADAMFEYYMTLNQWNIEPSIVRRLADDSAGLIDWLLALGVEFKPEKLYCAGVESVPRGHMTEGAGFTLFQRLEQTAAVRGVERVVNTRVDSLLRDASNQVTGVRCGNDAVKSGAAVLSCGGLGGNTELLRQYYPSMSAHGDWACYFGGKHNRGDAITLGRSVGAAVAGFNRGSPILTPNFSKLPDAYLPGWLVVVNREGRRFMDESAPYAVLDGLVDRQTDRRCFAIIDEATRAWSRPDPSITDPLQLGETMAYNWVGEEIARQAAAGRIATAETLDSLANKLGIRAGTLRTTIANYNADVARDADSRFFKKYRPLRKVETPPFYAVELRAASYAITGTGLRIDVEARVLNLDDLPIAGLFAAGESAGSVFGDRYYAGGCSLGSALTFGRIAGRNAAVLAQNS
jgi:fumarate reductase flavoprotein subunit